MKKYIGKKTVQAIPMTVETAIEKGYRVGERRTGDGYEVTYEDGYKSWSPADVFEKAYVVADTFLDRLYIEHQEESDRLVKAQKFLTTEQYNSLSDIDKKLLVTQIDLMGAKVRILEMRIARAK